MYSKEETEEIIKTSAFPFAVSDDEENIIEIFTVEAIARGNRTTENFPNYLMVLRNAEGKEFRAEYVLNKIKGEKISIND